MKATLYNRLEAIANGDDTGAVDSFAVPIEAPLLAVKARNTSGSTDLDAYVPCELKTTDIDPEAVKTARRRPMLEIIPATWYASLGSLGITLEPIPQGKVGLVAIAGMCTAHVDVVSVDHPCATLHPTSVGQLRSCDSGDFKLIKPPATGAKLCNVIVGQRDWLWKCVLTQDWQAAGTTAKLQTMAGVDYHASAAITVLDPDAMLDDLVNTNACYVKQKGNKFYALTAACIVEGPY